MMPRYKPSQEDVEQIKRAAALEAGISVGSVILEPGIRCGENGHEPSMNVALVSSDPRWADTDLHDYGTWADFRAGVELSDQGNAIVDFYIRRRSDDELHGNVTAYIEGGRLVRIDGASRTLWRSTQAEQEPAERPRCAG